MNKLDHKIRSLAPQWLTDEVDELIELALVEKWEFQPKHYIDCFDWWEGQDWTDTRKYKLTMTKLERACGVQVQLGKGEESQVFSGDSCRTYREGDWVFEKKWEELTD